VGALAEKVSVRNHFGVDSSLEDSSDVPFVHAINLLKKSVGCLRR
jgi:hypothetical protein